MSFDRSAFVTGQDLLVGQHFCVSNTAKDVLLKQPSVKTDAFGETLDTLVHGRIECAAATGTGQIPPLFDQTMT
jgi:hypothetical protein